MHSLDDSLPPSAPPHLAGGLISMVLPAYNEQDVLPETYRRFSVECPKWAAQFGLDYEIVFVNDGSRDRTAAMLDGLAAADPHVRAVHLTRNFGHQAAISAGLTVARGAAVAIMDCDLQDPPEVLPQFIRRWRDGNQVVYAIRKKRKEWAGKRLAYWSFYRLLAAVSELEIPLDSGDFCLMDRSAVDLLNGLPERGRFVRGLRTWVGLKQVGVEYERDARQAGVPQYTFSKLLKLAMDGLISFSSVPLKFVTRLGVASAAAAVLAAVWVVAVSVHKWMDVGRAAIVAGRDRRVPGADLPGSEGPADVPDRPGRGPAGGRGKRGDAVAGRKFEQRGRRRGPLQLSNPTWAT